MTADKRIRAAATNTDAERFPFSSEDRARLHEAGIQFHEIAGHDTAKLEESDAVFVWFGLYDAAALARLRRCRVLARCGTGYDNIDVEAARARGITVTYVPGYSTDEVADHALALLLACSRRMVQGDRAMRAGKWLTYQELGPIRRLRGSTLGVVGFGAIGRALARKARAFGMKVIACDPQLDDRAFADEHVKRVALDELLRRSDHVSLHAAGHQTLLGPRELALLRPHSILINTARGGLVDSHALADALRSGRILAAGIDVLEVEPPPPGHPLLGLPNVVTTPHSASFSEEAFAELRGRAVTDVIRVLSGQPPLNPVPATIE